jgi:hypothetical protein
MKLTASIHYFTKAPKSILQFISTSLSSATDLLTGINYSPLVHTDELYIADYKRVLLKLSLKQNYIDSVWSKITHKP